MNEIELAARKKDKANFDSSKDERLVSRLNEDERRMSE